MGRVRAPWGTLNTVRVVSAQTTPVQFLTESRTPKVVVQGLSGDVPPPSLLTSSTTVGAVFRKQLGESFLPFLENASLCSMNENIGPWQAPSGSGMGVKGRGGVSPWNRRERRAARLFPFLFLSVPAKS